MIAEIGAAFSGASYLTRSFVQYVLPLISTVFGSSALTASPVINAIASFIPSVVSSSLCVYGFWAHCNDFVLVVFRLFCGCRLVDRRATVLKYLTRLRIEVSARYEFACCRLCLFLLLIGRSLCRLFISVFQVQRFAGWCWLLFCGACCRLCLISSGSGSLSRFCFRFLCL